MPLPNSSNAERSLQDESQSVPKQKGEETPAPQSTIAPSSSELSISQSQLDPFDASRVGWTPRFHIPDEDIEAEGPGDTLLDHQTWLESKLSDKWFGGELPHRR